MKLDYFTKRDVYFFVECTAVFVFLLVPPLFSAEPFRLPPKPDGLYAQSIFCVRTLCAALYEEVLYRLYVPHRLHRLYAARFESDGCQRRRHLVRRQVERQIIP